MTIDTEHALIQLAWTSVVLEDAGLIIRVKNLPRDRRAGLWTRNRHFLAYCENENTTIRLALARWAMEEGGDLLTWHRLVYDVANYIQY